VLKDATLCERAVLRNDSTRPQFNAQSSGAVHQPMQSIFSFPGTFNMPIDQLRQPLTAAVLLVAVTLGQAASSEQLKEAADDGDLGLGFKRYA
jgi:hypothetical protein